MTRARALKHVIRARAAKTGERYTTARRHVLRSLKPRIVPVVQPPPAAVASSPAAKVKGGLSESTSRRITGHGLEHWFEVLDRFGGVEKGHPPRRAIWPTIIRSTVGMRRASRSRSNARAACAPSINEVTASTKCRCRRSSPPPAGEVIKLFTDKRLRKPWVTGVDQQLVKAFSAALDSPKSKGFVVRPDGQGRWRYKWGETTVQCYLYPKPGGKVSVVVTNLNLSGPTWVEERRALWKTSLQALATHLAA